MAGHFAPTLILEMNTLLDRFCSRYSRTDHFGTTAKRMVVVGLAGKFEAIMIGELIWIAIRLVAPSVFAGTRPMDSVVGCKFVDLMVEDKWNRTALSQRSFSDHTKRHYSTDN